MQKVKVERVTHYQKDKNDQPLVSKKTGKPYERCMLQTNKGSLSGFGSATTHNLKEGDEIELEITSNEYNGTTYQNFKLPNPYVTRAEHQEALKRIEVLEAFIQGPQVDAPLPQGEEPPLDDQIDDLFSPEENVA